MYIIKTPNALRAFSPCNYIG